MKVKPGLFPFKIVSAEKELPPLGTKVVVYTKEGHHYVAARVEHSKANTLWGLLFRDKVIGVVENVTHWGLLVKKEKSNELESGSKG